MGDIYGIPALFTACIALCMVLNFLLFYKERKAVLQGIILGSLLFVNQVAEFISSFYQINNPMLSFAYIMTFNFSVSFASFYLLQKIQPDSKHNWKAFMFSVMLLPAGFVYISTFKMIESGFFFAGYRYFASPLANIIVGLIQSFIGLFFFYKFYFADADRRKLKHYKFVFWGYTIPPFVFIVSIIISVKSALYFESIYSKLMLLTLLSLFYLLIKSKPNAGNNS